ncbi:DUF742 domain-containing protein [Streptomyces sp. CA-111067]|uniref:DUF742 domain-containing protein n=1 Tax=Streptomyces sp. CA-111067 TaxID=3240046 RepID=UPI003D9780E2
MTGGGPVDSGGPDRLYTVTGGRSRPRDNGLDLVTFVISEGEPVLGMQSEHVRIMRLCRAYPVAVVEIAAHLNMPVGVVKILLGDLLADGRVSARRPRSVTRGDRLPPSETLKKVLSGLHKL